MIATVLVIFLILWIIIGVGALILLFKAFKLINKFEKQYKTLEANVKEITNLLSPLLERKEYFAILGTLLGLFKYLKGLRKDSKKTK